eukprot:14665-Eustigmatos_ZCMA.PRE.1
MHSTAPLRWRYVLPRCRTPGGGRACRRPICRFRGYATRRRRCGSFGLGGGPGDKEYNKAEESKTGEGV